MIPEALLCGSWWAAFSISTFITYYLPESCQVKVLEIIACEVVIHSCLCPVEVRLQNSSGQ